MRRALADRAEMLERETYALILAYRHPRTPWHARVWTVLVLAYALSPVDLIPDFVPVLGYLDDLLLVPLGISLALRMIPPEVMRECRETASERTAAVGLRRAGAALVAGIWLSLAVILLARVLRACQ